MVVPPRLLHLFTACGLALTAVSACDLDGGVGAGGVGAPCNDSTDCEESLACDVHAGKGSCQVPHDHGTESESESESGSTSSSTSTTDPTNSTTDPGTTTTDATGTTGDPSESATESGTSEGGETETGTTTGEPSVCESFCACMLINCSSYDAYPYADTDACLAACEQLDEPTLQCYGRFCEDAAVEESSDLAEHWCEHAWGELGQDEC